MPTYSANSFDFLSRAPEQTRRVGFRLGSMLKPGDVLALHGDLGAGKTTFVQGIAQGWGATDEVSSPTFVLVNVYRRPDGTLLHHMDAYRIQSALEAEDLDLDEMMRSGALLVEWAERIQSALPQEHLEVQLAYVNDEQRSLAFYPHGKRYEALAGELKHLAFGG
ncbi:MAG: tRNA (adenosine(37)-N6)-threonylcarbamoyltransferase complex ATPase subunit type 1 TsaE [Anaerolineaceae bacterium]|nr:tRNA (adenosine(37)-N6)-threonylcarbamoyltransferase complex ATPase subunit type 1 TsaE [Anaerolineaceae bacterium]